MRGTWRGSVLSLAVVACSGSEIIPTPPTADPYTPVGEWRRTDETYGTLTLEVAELTAGGGVSGVATYDGSGTVCQQEPDPTMRTPASITFDVDGTLGADSTLQLRLEWRDDPQGRVGAYVGRFGRDEARTDRMQAQFNVRTGGGCGSFSGLFTRQP